MSLAPVRAYAPLLICNYGTLTSVGLWPVIRAIRNLVTILPSLRSSEIGAVQTLGKLCVRTYYSCETPSTEASWSRMATLRGTNRCSIEHNRRTVATVMCPPASLTADPDAVGAKLAREHCGAAA